MTDRGGQEKKTTKRDKDSAEQQPEAGVDKAKAEEAAKRGEKIKKNIDKLLDEIDDLLEENAEEFVKSYVQRGGE